MKKYIIDLGINIDTSRLYKSLKDINLKIKELNKNTTLNGLEIKDKEKYLIKMEKIEKDIQKEFAERLYSANPIVC